MVGGCVVESKTSRTVRVSKPKRLFPLPSGFDSTVIFQFLHQTRDFLRAPVSRQAADNPARHTANDRADARYHAAHHRADLRARQCSTGSAGKTSGGLRGANRGVPVIALFHILGGVHRLVRRRDTADHGCADYRGASGGGGQSPANETGAALPGGFLHLDCRCFGRSLRTFAQKFQTLGAKCRVARPFQHLETKFV